MALKSERLFSKIIFNNNLFSNKHFKNIVELSIVLPTQNIGHNDEHQGSPQDFFKEHIFTHQVPHTCVNQR